MEILGIPISHFLIMMVSCLVFGIIALVGCSWFASQVHKDAKRNMRHILKCQHLEYYLRTGDEKQIDIIERLREKSVDNSE
jgi:hypothetical protein